jgi:hypothetical protein
VQDIVATVLANRERIFQRISEKELARYDFLQSNLKKLDVSSDREYQRTFNSFYVVQRRKVEWYGFFYEYLEAHKGNSQIAFGRVLRDFFSVLGRVEPSFASKLVATIRPDAPVYDAFVRQNLGLTVPPQYKTPEVRINGLIDVYSKMEGIYAHALSGENAAALETEFDLRFPAYAHFTQLKKLDLMLWQMR